MHPCNVLEAMNAIFAKRASKSKSFGNSSKFRFLAVHPPDNVTAVLFIVTSHRSML